MKARSAPRSWDGLWPARARRHPTSPTTLTTRPRRTATRPSTVVSRRTQRWEDRSMGQTGIRGPSPLMEKSLWGWEEARNMGATTLVTVF